MKNMNHKVKTASRALGALTAGVMLFTSCSAPAAKTEDEPKPATDAAATDAPKTDAATPAATDAPKTDQAATPASTAGKDQIIAGGLPDPATFIANQNSSTGTSTFGDYAFEGLIRYQRSTDDIALQLAESFTNEGNKTIFKLHDNIKWSDGQPFTSKDVWAFYQLCLNSPVNYLTSIETPDDKTVEFVWAEPAPSNDLRIMLVSQEVHHGRLPYHIYKEFVDKAAAVLAKIPQISDADKATGKRGPYGKDRVGNADLSKELDDIWQAYIKTPPNPEHTIIGTGPYINDPGFTQNEGSMHKNEFYWHPEGQKFDRIIIRATTDATKANMIKSGQVNWIDGTLPKDLTDSLLASAPNILYYPMEDPACHGVYFNTTSKNAPFDKKEFRQAMIYLANKEAMRDIGSYQSNVHPWSSTGISPSMLTKYVDQSVLDKMTKYDHDEAKATQLLESIGCKKDNGKWLNPDGTPMKIMFGLDKNWFVATLVTPIYANQLKQFGIDAQVMAVDGSVYGKQAEQDKAFDMMWEWIDVAWSLSYPYFPLNNYYGHDGGPAKKMSFPFDAKSNKTTMQLTDWDGQSFDVQKWIDDMLTQPDQAVSKDHWQKIIWATNDNAFAFNFYQNVTASWENMATTGGLPMLDKIPENRWMPFPETPEEKLGVSTLNVGFTGGIRKIWMLYPKG